MKRGGLHLNYFVYFAKPVGMDGPIKIGCSSMPADRLMGLGVWSPIPLELIGYVRGTFKDEKLLHQVFSDSHSHFEWFRTTPALLETIRRVLELGSVSSWVLRTFPDEHNEQGTAA